MFKGLLRRNMEVYVDGMMVKEKQPSNHIFNLEEVFRVIKGKKIRLNLRKCVFSISSGKFLRYLISFQGIEANPNKIKTLMNMKYPSNLKGVQQMNGQITTLIRFILRCTDKYLPFFQIIKEKYFDLLE